MARDQRWTLTLRDGRAVLVRGDRTKTPAELSVTPALAEALTEWARVAEIVLDREPADAESAELLTRRGERLALRLVRETGDPVDFRDPRTGRLRRFGGRRRQEAVREPTPWSTGLTVSAVSAAMVAVALVVVSLGLAELSGALAIGVNLLVAAGFAPSIWLGRRVPVWRWVAFGVATGVLLAWFALLLSLLGS